MEIEQLLQRSVDCRASDLHLLPKLPPLVRIDGELQPIPDLPDLTPEDTRRLIHALLSTEELTAFEQQLVSELAVSVPEIGNFRVSVFHELNGVAAVFRVITKKIPSFDELALPAVLKSLLVLPHGLVLITGPTGSGKTTTLAAMIDTINMMRACHIITIEDPIEYVFQSKKSAITQLQVGRDTPSIAVALRSALRQDPNVIMLGEMRDLETMNLALVAAETGHLVFATLHASSAPLAVSRLVDMFPTEDKNRVRNLLSETLQAVICQTLVKKESGGRVAAFEIMLANTAVRNMIRLDKVAQIETTIQTSGDVGMCTMEQYLDVLAAKRIITTASARAITANRDSFKVTSVNKLKGK